ncbi:MAG: UvrD-helicase domain-containing protein [Chitinophagales bacterium]|nr:UvrD-helicase domain-containing protein [Chitinophagales bacterium]MDW8427049.1 3'-5' exonuclease [Chitinophagales bacterium]
MALQEAGYFYSVQFLDELNAAQRQAVEATEGPIMIVAGPGSGKTRVLTYRIAYLLQGGEDAFRILALTFTNKAAREMRQRVEQLCGPEARNLYIGTFHSVFARLLRVNAHRLGFPADFVIYDTDDSRSLLKTIIKEMGLSDSLYKPTTVHNRISAVKNCLIGPEEYLRDANLMADDAASGRPRLGEIYAEYTLRCFKAGAMDFDDLLYLMYKLLTRFPDVLSRYQYHFKYILIDEFQDTNPAQYLIVRKLADVHQNICVVGDDAQSIYSFRGATLQNMLHFEQDYPERKLFKLEQNYRSTKQIVRAANRLIQNNKLQITKELWTENEEGEKIRLISALSDSEEGKLVVDMLFEEKMQYRRRNRDFAILYRTHAQSRVFEEQLRRVNVPYVVYGGVAFYQRKEIKDLLAYLRLTVNPYDEESLRRVINYPARGIGETSLEKAMLAAKQHNLRLWDVLEQCQQYLPGNRSNAAIQDFVSKIKSYRLLAEQQNAYEVALYIARSSGLWQELSADKSAEGLHRLENVQELLNGIKAFTESQAQEQAVVPLISADGEVLETTVAPASLGAYLQEITLLTDQDHDDDQADRVLLMTIHSAKGLEFPCVFVVGMEENLFPNVLSQSSREELEEERRLFYVAVTRAQEKLFISHAAMRYRYGELQYNEPSRFIFELDPDLMTQRKAVLFQRAAAEGYTRATQPLLVPKVAAPQALPDFVPDDHQLIQIGMEVEHPRFGIGKVIQMEGKSRDRIATVVFGPPFGEKRIMLRYARMRIVRAQSPGEA